MDRRQTTSDLEKAGTGPLTFKKQFTVSIITYLTLQNILITTTIAGFATGCFYSYSNSANQQSTDFGLEQIYNYAKLQQGAMCEEVHDHVGIFLTDPEATLRTSAHLNSTGLVKLEDWSQVHRWFFKQIQEYEMVNLISFVEYPSNDVFGIRSSRDGDSANYTMMIFNSYANRICPEIVSVNGSCPITSGNMTEYPITTSDEIDFSAATTKFEPLMFDSINPTDLGIYAMSDAPKNAVSWYPTVRASNDKEGMLGLYYVYPVWKDDETFLGSFVGEMDLSIVHELLEHLKEESTENTVIYLFQQHDEAMVATSTASSIITYDSELKTTSAVKVSDVDNSFIKLSHAHLRSEFGGSFSSAPADEPVSTQFIDPSTGITYVIETRMINPGTNLEWIMVIGAPQEDYTGTMIAVQESLYNDLQTNNRNVVVMIFAFQFVLMLAVMTILWYRVVKPLRTLVVGMNKAKEFDFTAISEGTFRTSPSALSEVYECEKAFFDMTTKFANAFKTNRSILQISDRKGSKTHLLLDRKDSGSIGEI